MSCYIIKCKCHEIYVGSTLRELHYRQKEHQSECFNEKREAYSSCAYKHFRDCNMDRKDIICEKICDVTAEDRLAVEAKWIDHLGSLNTYSTIADPRKLAKRNEKYKLRGKIKQQCVCGGLWSYYHKDRHIRTNLHQNYLNDEYKKKLKYLHNLYAEEIKTKANLPKVVKIQFGKTNFVKSSN